jgi:hypothetical protein
VVRITKGCMYVSTMNIVMHDKVRSCARLAMVVPHHATILLLPNGGNHCGLSPFLKNMLATLVLKKQAAVATPVDINTAELAPSSNQVAS